VVQSLSLCICFAKIYLTNHLLDEATCAAARYAEAADDAEDKGENYKGGNYDADDGGYFDPLLLLRRQRV